MSLEELAAIVAIIGALVAASAAIVRFYRNKKEKGTKKISIELTDQLEEKYLRYGVLHVQDGGDEDPTTVVKNEEHYLEKRTAESTRPPSNTSKG